MHVFIISAICLSDYHSDIRYQRFVSVFLRWHVVIGVVSVCACVWKLSVGSKGERMHGMRYTRA